MCGSDLLKKLLSPQKFTFDLQLQIVSFKPPAPTYARSPQSSTLARSMEDRGRSLLIGQRGHYKVIVSAQRNSQKLVDVNIGKIHVRFHIIHIWWISGKEIIQSRRKQLQIKNTLVDVLILLLHTALFLQHFFLKAYR